nr:hypothetical protein XfCFBP8356_07965 [Xylella fastidiosa subsp. sandyi]
MQLGSSISLNAALPINIDATPYRSLSSQIEQFPKQTYRSILATQHAYQQIKNLQEGTRKKGDGPTG